MTLGQVHYVGAVIVFTILGGAFSIGQLLAVEIGRYEIWSPRRRLFVGSALYLMSFIPVMAAFVLLKWGFSRLPWLLIVALVLEKKALNQLSLLMPERFQPTDKELREKYGELFKVDQGEINEIIEDEFTKKLGFERRGAIKPKRISLLMEYDSEDDEGLTEAIESYMEKERGDKKGAGEA